MMAKAILVKACREAAEICRRGAEGAEQKLGRRLATRAADPSLRHRAPACAKPPARKKLLQARGSGGRTQLDDVAELFKSSCEASCRLGMVMSVEVVMAQVLEDGAVAQHVVGGGEHRGRDGDDG